MINNKSFLFLSKLFYCNYNINHVSRYIQYLARKNQVLNFRNLHINNQLAANVSFKLSDIGEGIREVVVKEWYVKEGDKVAQFDNICEVQSDKASVTITSRYDGVISKLHHKIDDIALVGQPLIDIETNEGEPEQLTNATEAAQINESVERSSEEIKVPEPSATSIIDNSDIISIPSVRRLAKEHSIQLSKIQGTGKSGRITKEDVLKYLENDLTKTATKPYSSDNLIEKVVKVKGFQKAMVKSMTEVLKIPTFTYSDEIKVTKLSELRQTLKTINELKDLKITYMPFFIKAVSNALSRYPIINSHYDEENESIVYKRHHNIAMAMDTSIGLAIPVIKRVQDLSIFEIAKEIQRLIKCGKENNFSPSDLSEPTFLLSNIGVVGGTYTKPLMVDKTSVVIALGATQVLPRFDSSMNVVAEQIIALSASADHRIIDGATAARFCMVLKKQIEDPYLLLMNL